MLTDREREMLERLRDARPGKVDIEGVVRLEGTSSYWSIDALSDDMRRYVIRLRLESLIAHKIEELQLKNDISPLAAALLALHETGVERG